MFFDYAEKYRPELKNPARVHKVASYKTHPQDNRKKVYTFEERQKLIAYLSNSNNVYDLALALQFCLGCRISELKALHWCDIDWNKRDIYIHRSVITKGNSHLKNACDALGIRYLSSHKIRATVVTEALRKQMDIVTAMYTLGWSDKDTVTAYIRPGRTEAEQQKVFSDLDVGLDIGEENESEEDIEP